MNVSKKRRILVVLVALLVSVAVAGWKCGGSAQASTGIECSPFCNVNGGGPPPHLPAPGPCFYHWGVAWVIGQWEGFEWVLYYGCQDGTVIRVGG